MSTLVCYETNEVNYSKREAARKARWSKRTIYRCHHYRWWHLKREGERHVRK